MTLARPVLPPLPPRGRPWGLLAGVAVVVGVIAYLAFSSVGNALVYYVTPTELVSRGDSALGETVRLGGLVKPDSLNCRDGGITYFTVTDGRTDIQVLNAIDPESLLCPREGVGVVVQGKLGTKGTFEATEIIIKHDENYVAPSEGGLPTQAFDPGS
jgi:cytochrome c-type biogenesis protein CcmE